MMTFLSSSRLLVAVLLLAKSYATDNNEQGQQQSEPNSPNLRQRNLEYFWQRSTSTSYAIFGDWPYSQSLLNDAHKLVDSVNGDTSVTTAIHLGDIHSGSMPCTGAGMNNVAATLTTSSDVAAGTPLPVVNPTWNIHVFNQFMKLKNLVYTPGTLSLSCSIVQPPKCQCYPKTYVCPLY
jgi:hypothetical protein